jgi:DNA-directed RNA polymerase subunit alpha
MDHAEVRDVNTAQKYLKAGREAEAAGNRFRAIEAYEAAFAADPDDADVCFKLAYALDLVGEEEEAVHLYEQSIQRPQPPLNALINLSIMYEDRGQYAAAERCLRQVLATDPNHARARLYIKDVLASTEMIVDDDREKQMEKYHAVLDTPVTDFDLSVRTRNALRKMNIRTLADLLRITEAELRSYKNFGESSIEEIRAMLAQRGLRLGETVEQQHSAAKQAVYDQLKTETGGDDSLLNRSVNELDLSVRARKALNLLGVQSIGDLCMKTEAELMGVKNFGVTSLSEIKEKLTTVGLALRQLEE